MADTRRSTDHYPSFGAGTPQHSNRTQPGNRTHSASHSRRQDSMTEPITAHHTAWLNSHTPHQSQFTTSTLVGRNGSEHGVLENRIAGPNDMIKCLEKMNEDLKQQLTEQSDQIRQLKEDNKTLRRQCNEGAERSFTSSQPQRPLSKPSNEIVKDWYTLAYDVENFVDNHFRDASERKIISWAAIKSKDLPSIVGAPYKIVTSHKSGLALIKAALWFELGNQTFASLCWAGHYRKDMSILDKKLEADFSARGTASLPPSHHHCRALMANLISTLETSDQRKLEVENAALHIEELLAPCRPRQSSSNTYHLELRAVVHKAIDMDLVLAGQMDVYTFHWSRGETFEEAFMAPAPGCSRGSGNSVRFMIRPGLYRADAQGDTFKDFNVVQKATVWL